MKICYCGVEFCKKQRESKAQWEDRIFCSKSCANRNSGDLRAENINLRFWKHVPFRPTGYCWLWNGPRSLNYGTINKGKMHDGAWKAHRVSYEMMVGEIPLGMVVRHKCDNPPCVNPDHLEIGTQKDNVRDMVKRGRMNPKSLCNLKSNNKKEKQNAQ